MSDGRSESQNFRTHIVGIKALVGLASILSTLVPAQAVMLVLACMKLNYTRAQAVTLVLACKGAHPCPRPGGDAGASQ
jgi:hypothetical protein